MNKSIILALAAAGTLLTAGAARAADVQWSVGINLPVPGLVIGGAPYYREPARVYAPAPAYYAPATAYYAPEPVYYPGHPQWRHHYRPAPVVVEVPRYRHDWQPVVSPRFHNERRDGRHDDRRDDRHDRRN